MLACQICKKQMRGRADKKFCSIKCKNQFHQEKRKQNIPIIKEIDQILHHNRELCETLWKNYPDLKMRVPKITLERMGFNFSHYTGSMKNSQGKWYHYVYDYAWMEFSTQDVMLIKMKKKGFK